MTDIQLRMIARCAKQVLTTDAPHTLEQLRKYTGMLVEVYGGPLPHDDLLVLYTAHYMESDPYVFDEHGNQITDEAVYETVREKIHEDVLDRFTRVRPSEVEE
jgi:hypothetical protein